MKPVEGRHVDKLDAVPDAKLQEADKAYLAKHSLDQFFADILHNLITDQPADPLQYVIDTALYGADYAKQDPATGLPEHRKHKLLEVFRAIDKEGTGRISYRMLTQFTTKYGGTSLTAEETKSIFADFNPSTDNLINETEFLLFFSRVSKTIDNTAFQALVNDMLA